MTKPEFDAWTKETKFSENKWVRDIPHSGRETFYKGGIDGVYIMIFEDGTVNVGEYKGAIPHIGEASFAVKHSGKPLYHGRPAATLDEGFAAIMERLGLGFLIDLCRRF
jgi:hypothetical protein